MLPVESLLQTLSGFFSHWRSDETDVREVALLDEPELRQLAIYARSLTDSLFEFDREAAHPQPGDIPSHYRGRGFEFEENRNYQAGDEQRLINWRLFARSGDLYTKVFREERRPQVFLLIDRRAAMRFATRRQLKVTLAAGIGACYCYQAIHQALPVGGMLLNRRIDWFDAAITEMAAQHFIESLTLPCPPLDFEEAQPSLEEALQQLLQRLPDGSYVLLLSDFLDLDTDTAMPLLHQLSSRHRLQAIQVLDPVERQLPETGDFLIEDGAAALPLRIGASDAMELRQYATLFEEAQEKLKACFDSCGIRFSSCSTEDDVMTCMESIYASAH
ncbi:DUF58 domain-containing protein [Thiolapillus sp.]